MRRWIAGILCGGTVVVTAACTSWQAYAPAASVALAPKATLKLPLHENYRHWLLISESGWCGASVARWGGDDGEPGVVIVRTAVFKDSSSAARAYPKMTADYIYRSLRSEMVRAPWPVEYPQPLPGDKVNVFAYDVRLPPFTGPDFRIYGQITTIHAGRSVFLVESIGVPPEQLVPAISDLTHASSALPRKGC